MLLNTLPVIFSPSPSDIVPTSKFSFLPIKVAFPVGAVIVLFICTLPLTSNLVAVLTVPVNVSPPPSLLISTLLFVPVAVVLLFVFKNELAVHVPLKYANVCDDEPEGNEAGVAHDGDVPLVVRYLPEFPVCEGSSISLVALWSAAVSVIVPLPVIGEPDTVMPPPLAIATDVTVPPELLSVPGYHVVPLYFKTCPLEGDHGVIKSVPLRLFAFHVATLYLGYNLLLPSTPMYVLS